MVDIFSFFRHNWYRLVFYHARFLLAFITPCCLNFFLVFQGLSDLIALSVLSTFADVHLENIIILNERFIFNDGGCLQDLWASLLWLDCIQRPRYWCYIAQVTWWAFALFRVNIQPLGSDWTVHHYIGLLLLSWIAVHLQINIGHIHWILLIHFVSRSLAWRRCSFTPFSILPYRLWILTFWVTTHQQLLNIVVLDTLLLILTGDTRPLFHVEGGTTSFFRQFLFPTAWYLVALHVYALDCVRPLHGRRSVVHGFLLQVVVLDRVCHLRRRLEVWTWR